MKQVAHVLLFGRDGRLLIYLRDPSTRAPALAGGFCSGFHPTGVLEVATGLSVGLHNKSEIPFPDHWDFFGGHLEAGETPEDALVREVEEELVLTLKEWKYFRTYVCTEGDAYPNIKYIYWSRIDQAVDELTLREGQMLKGIAPEERSDVKFANILGRILEDFVAAELWPDMVDNS